MAFRNWRLGMHIQQDSIAIVALLHERSHWALRRWWRIPLPPGLVRQGMVADVSALGSRLAAWRRELPAQHQVSIAFPAVRTLQKRLPYPQFALREREQATWVASAMSQQLAMPASALCIDYAPTSQDDGWQVTAAQRLDINVLRELAGRLRLRVAAIVPDASALGAFFPWMTAADQGLAWRDEKRWLWATREAWGSDACADVGSLSQLAGQLQVPLRLCIDAGDEASRFDVWQVIHRRQPPLPADGDRYAIALGLALGGGRHDAYR
ncbi:pilus assembly protein [Klebsiella pneumoniae]|uniref:pilus assembly protein n=1 Tax=Klebsiella pneumoniae TaxID=573 RepID=UPI000E2D56D6|nr:pilus assembly protein [Klebsiella pneumoniae]SXP29740.1 pilus assembly protein [Klebsiella pneumoniae]HBS7467220.1 pilus assembly protein [Klebsiella pneumoniae]HCB0385381.1 pilus assembly protein [Klebsiella pneumoniae]